MVATYAAAHRLNAIIPIETFRLLSRVVHKHNIAFERSVLYRYRGSLSRPVCNRSKPPRYSRGVVRFEVIQSILKEVIAADIEINDDSYLTSGSNSD
jgi:hypothetical protein